MTAHMLRPYQLDAYARTRAAFLAGATAALLVLPTGGGKTLLGSEFVRQAVARGHAVEWYAHREELIEQARTCFIGQGIPLSRVSILSVQTAIKRPPPREVPRVRVFDEAHHFAADQWGRLAAPAPGCAIIGLTATPERGDGRGLGREHEGPFDVMLQVSSVRELQKLGVLVPCVTYAPSSPTKVLSQDPVAAYLARAPGERCLVFCRDVAHAEKLTMQFLVAGVPAACLHGDTKSDLRRARLDAFASQSSQPMLMVGAMEKPPLVLCNAHLLTEGLDVRAISCVILARGCEHAGAMLQMVGRGMRAVEGKSRCVFIDLRGVTRRRYHKGPRKGHLVLGLPEDDRSWSLAGRVHDVADADAERALHTCPACEATVGTWSTDQEGWRTCPACRTRLKAPTINAQVVARDLEAFGSAVPEAERLQALRAEAKKAARLGYKPGYVAHRYLERFGVWPPFGAADAAFTDAVRDRARPPTPRRKSKAAIEAELAEHGDAWEGDDGE